MVRRRSSGRGGGGDGECLDDGFDSAGDAEWGLVLVVHGEAADERGSEGGDLRGGRRAEDEGAESPEEAVDGGDRLLEVGVEGEVEEGGESERGGGEGKKQREGAVGEGDEVTVVTAELGEAGESLEGHGADPLRLRLRLSQAFRDGVDG